MARVRITAAALVAAVVLACIADPVPRENFYRLPVPAPSPVASGAALEGVLLVQRLGAEGLLTQRPLLYAVGEAGPLHQYSYHLWVDAPTRMLQLSLAGFLRDAQVASAVVTPRLRVRADYQLSGRLLALERIEDDASPRVRVALEFALEDLEARELLLLREYRVVRPAEDDGMRAAVDAMRAAVGELYGRLLVDLVTPPAPRTLLTPRAGRG